MVVRALPVSEDSSHWSLSPSSIVGARGQFLVSAPAHSVKGFIACARAGFEGKESPGPVFTPIQST